MNNRFSTGAALAAAALCCAPAAAADGNPATETGDSKVTILNPSGSVKETFTGTTNSSGVVTFKGKLTGRDRRGTYSAGGTATLSSLNATATVTWVF